MKESAWVWIIAVGVAVGATNCSEKRPYSESPADVFSDLPYSIDFLKPFLSPQQIYTLRTRHESLDSQALRAIISTTPDLALEMLTELLTNEGVGNETIQRYAGSVYAQRMFWASVSNETCSLKTGPTGPLETDINTVWGSFDGFQTDFSRQGGSTRGSGWTWLCFSNQDSRLRVLTTRGSVNPLSLSPIVNRCTPILVFPHWEHCYYLQYAYDKMSFLAGFLRGVDWDVVSEWYRLFGQYGQPVPL